MSLQIWKERVLTEYKKLKAFDDIERANLIKTEWKNNCIKHEMQISQGIETSALLKWDNPINEELTICYLKEQQPIPKGNKWTLINSNKKCPAEEENMLYNLPYTKDDDCEFVSAFSRNYENVKPTPRNQRFPPINDNLLVKLVECLKQKYFTGRRKYMFSNLKTVIFKAISHHFFKQLTPGMLIDKYNKLVENETSAEEEKMQIESCVNSRKNIFSKLFCTQCYKYGCILHWNGERHEATSSSKPWTYVQEIAHKPNEPCGYDCFLLTGSEDKECDEELDSSSSLQASKTRRLVVKTETKTWDSAELELFRTLRDIFKNNYCIIAKSIGKKSCKDVYQLSLKEKSEKLEKTCDVISTTPTTKLRKISRAKKNRILYSAHIKPNEMRKMYPYTPCDHPGEQHCNDSCVCLQSQNFCEKFCKCQAELCRNRFIGCVCKSKCETKKCICYSYQRECDPDLCKNCGTHEFETKGAQCKNVNIQRGVSKHLLLALSDIAGWGIFLKNGAKRNEYITEYCGEIITQEEANRRGEFYDKSKSSFLFDLNEEFVIDATYMGSKIRFANHSDNPNCYPKVIKVLGDYRIGIFAKKDIQAGEELCFDYKYELPERIKFLSKNV